MKNARKFILYFGDMEWRFSEHDEEKARKAFYQAVEFAKAVKDILDVSLTLYDPQVHGEPDVLHWERD